jgi:nuclear GTP-binding protein
MTKSTASKKRLNFKANNKKFIAAKATAGKGSAFKRSGASTNPHRPDPSGGKVGSQFRTKATINRLNMYRAKPNEKKMKELPKDPNAGKIQPDRRWFGNVRTVDQKELERYRRTLEEQEQHRGSGVSVLVRNKKLPLSLVKEAFNKTTSKGEQLLQIESFKDTFGPMRKRKRPTIGTSNMDELINQANENGDNYDETKDVDYHKNDQIDAKDAAQHAIFSKGQSKRIWEELYKVIDSSDVLLYVLDARDPNGTRTKFIESYLRKKCPNKHLVFILNKCDLIPTSMTQKWVKYLSKTTATIAFQASVNNPFGKGSLIQLLKQFDVLHKDRKNISVGLIGYPNVGKSSVINAIMKKHCCKAAPVPGETKTWQYVTLTKRIYLIDCPGIVHDEHQTQTEKVLKNVIRAEKVPDPSQYIQAILDRVEKKNIQDVYGIHEWEDSEDFLKQLCHKTGKLIRGGEPDYNNVSKQIIVDWQRGNIPYFTRPPKDEHAEREEEKKFKEDDPTV